MHQSRPPPLGPISHLLPELSEGGHLVLGGGQAPAGADAVFAVRYHGDRTQRAAAQLQVSTQRLGRERQKEGSRLGLI